ncbi:hypothetical protein PCE1_004740 [Barthelona sp. PCE]
MSFEEDFVPANPSITNITSEPIESEPEDVVTEQVDETEPVEPTVENESIGMVTVEDTENVTEETKSVESIPSETEEEEEEDQEEEGVVNSLLDEDLSVAEEDEEEEEEEDFSESDEAVLERERKEHEDKRKLMETIFRDDFVGSDEEYSDEEQEMTLQDRMNSMQSQPSQMNQTVETDVDIDITDHNPVFEQDSSLHVFKPRSVRFAPDVFDPRSVDQVEQWVQVENKKTIFGFDKIRYKNDGSTNARVVKWSNGTKTLHIGDEIFMIKERKNQKRQHVYVLKDEHVQGSEVNSSFIITKKLGGTDPNSIKSFSVSATKNQKGSEVESIALTSTFLENK